MEAGARASSRARPPQEPRTGRSPPSPPASPVPGSTGPPTLECHQHDSKPALPGAAGGGGARADARHCYSKRLLEQRTQGWTQGVSAEQNSRDQAVGRTTLSTSDSSAMSALITCHSTRPSRRAHVPAQTGPGCPGRERLGGEGRLAEGTCWFDSDRAQGPPLGAGSEAPSSLRWPCGSARHSTEAGQFKAGFVSTARPGARGPPRQGLSPHRAGACGAHRGCLRRAQRGCDLRLVPVSLGGDPLGQAPHCPHLC